MTDSVYFYSGTISEKVYGTQLSKEVVKLQFGLTHRGISPNQHDTKPARTTIHDIKKQDKRYFVVGDIIPTPTTGSTAWEHQIMLGSLFELGGTFEFNAGSDGAYTGFVTKYKFNKKAAIDKYEATIEFLCGSSRG